MATLADAKDDFLEEVGRVRMIEAHLEKTRQAYFKARAEYFADLNCHAKALQELEAARLAFEIEAAKNLPHP